MVYLQNNHMMNLSQILNLNQSQNKNKKYLHQQKLLQNIIQIAQMHLIITVNIIHFIQQAFQQLILQKPLFLMDGQKYLLKIQIFSLVLLVGQFQIGIIGTIQTGIVIYLFKMMLHGLLEKQLILMFTPSIFFYKQIIIYHLHYQDFNKSNFL